MHFFIYSLTEHALIFDLKTDDKKKVIEITGTSPNIELFKKLWIGQHIGRIRTDIHENLRLYFIVSERCDIDMVVKYKIRERMDLQEKIYLTRLYLKSLYSPATDEYRANIQKLVSLQTQLARVNTHLAQELESDFV